MAIDMKTVSFFEKGPEYRSVIYVSFHEHSQQKQVDFSIIILQPPCGWLQDSGAKCLEIATSIR